MVLVTVFLAIILNFSIPYLYRNISRVIQESHSTVSAVILVSDLESCSASLRMEDSDHLEASVSKRRLVEKMATATGDSEDVIRRMDLR